MKKMKGSEALLEALINEGVDTIFGYPGGQIIPVYDALYNYTEGKNRRLRHVLVLTSKQPRMLPKAIRGCRARWVSVL